jgi:hypothetical protein
VHITPIEKPVRVVEVRPHQRSVDPNGAVADRKVEKFLGRRRGEGLAKLSAGH